MNTYRLWVFNLDENFLRSAQTVKSWVGTIFFVVVITLVVHLVPGVSERLGVNLLPGLPIFLLTGGFGLWNSYRFERGATVEQIGWGMLLEATLQMTFAVSLVAYASGVASGLLGCMALIIATYQGYSFNTTPRNMFGAVAIVLGIAFGLVLFPTARELVYMVFIWPLAIFLHVISGVWSEQTRRHREQAQQYKEALLANQLLFIDSENQALQHTLTDVRGLKHDLNNLFQVVEATGSLLTLCDLEPDASELLDDMTQAHHRMQALLRGFTTPQLSAAADNELGIASPIALDEVTGALVDHYRKLYAVSLECHTDSDCVISVRGGRPTIERVLDNLIKNAREGSGTSGASIIRLTTERSSDGGLVHMRVEDDGPGFSQKILESGFELFDTTKSYGTGLGLYIIDCIVSAHGGRVVFGTSEELGGASVSLVWPLSKST